MGKFLKNNWFLFTMILGILLGCLTGYLSPATSLNLSDTDANDLGIEITIKSDGSYSITQNVASDKAGTEVKGFQSGEWEKASDTEIILHPEDGEDVTVTLADGKWSCEIADPESETVSPTLSSMPSATCFSIAHSFAFSGIRPSRILTRFIRSVDVITFTLRRASPADAFASAYRTASTSFTPSTARIASTSATWCPWRPAARGRRHRRCTTSRI